MTLDKLSSKIENTSEEITLESIWEWFLAHRELAREYLFKAGRPEVIYWNALRGEFVSLVSPGGRILDIGSGMSDDSSVFAQGGFKVVSADKNPNRFKIRRYGGDVAKVLMNLRDLALAPESFDGILMGNVLMFLFEYQDKIRALSQSLVCMKPGAAILICDEFFPVEFLDNPVNENFQIPEAQAKIKLGLESCWRSGINCSLLVRAIVEILGFEIIKECVSVEIPEKAGFNTGDGFCVILARKPVASR